MNCNKENKLDNTRCQTSLQKSFSYKLKNVIIGGNNILQPRKYNSIDICKVIMSLCVVAIHTGLLCSCTNEFVNAVFDSFFGLAVPFFFLTSGFLLGNKLEYPFSDDNSINCIKQYLLRIVKLYFIWTLFYLPMAVYHYVTEETGLIKSIVFYIRGLFFIGEQYNSWHLWYLLSTIYALLLLIILLKIMHLKLRGIVVSGIVLFVIGTAITCLTTYKGNLTGILYWIQMLFSYSIGTGRIFSGAFYIPLGIVLSKIKFNIKIAWVMFLIGYTLNIIVDNLVATTVLVAISSIGLFVVVKGICLPDAKIYPFARKMSKVIYYIHMYIWTAYYTIVYGEKTYGADSFFATAIISIVLAVCYVCLRKKFKTNLRKKEMSCS